MFLTSNTQGFIMKKVLVLSLLLAGSIAVAMEPAKEAVAAVAKDAAKVTQEVGKNVGQTVADAAKKVADACHPHKDCNNGIFHSIQHAFKDGVSFANAQWTQALTTTATLKSNGWNALSKNEKVGVAVAGVAIAATTAYVIYKLYHAVTKADKNSKACVKGKQVRC